MTFWDSIEITEEDTGKIDYRLFGKENIGLLNRTNMQVAGMLAADQDFCFAGWSVTTAEVIGVVDESLDAMVRVLLANSIATLRFGDKPQAMHHMSDLHEEAQPLELHLPVRGYMGVDVALDSAALRRLRYNIGTEQAVRIWVNLEGWQIRTHG